MAFMRFEFQRLFIGKNGFVEVDVLEMRITFDDKRINRPGGGWGWNEGWPNFALRKSAHNGNQNYNNQQDAHDEVGV